MSLILEALKKSERQRRLGESPSIGSPIMTVRRRRSVLPALIGLIAVGLGVLWWMNREPDPAPASETTAQPTVAPPASPPVAPATRTPVILDGQTAQAPQTPERARSTAATRMPRSKVPADATSGLPAELREQVKSGEVVVAHPNLLKPGQPATIEEGAPPAASEAIEPPPPAREAVTAARVAPAATPPPPAPANKPARREPPAAPTAPVASAVPMIWELPLAVRRDLPDLALTMHVFAIAPENRFVIINGERRVEGDSIGDLALVEIRSDGVLLEREGQRFLLPRGGR